MKLQGKSFATVIYFTLLIVANLFVVGIAFVSGNSMLGGLHDKQIVIELKWHGPIQNGDVVITNRDNPYKVALIKRVIATEGQHLQITGSSVFVDGELLEEPYLYEKPSYGGEIDLILPPDTCFVMGDNRNHSNDSREIGCIAYKNIQGKVIWPVVREKARN